MPRSVISRGKTSFVFIVKLCFYRRFVERNASHREPSRHSLFLSLHSVKNMKFSLFRNAEYYFIGRNLKIRSRRVFAFFIQIYIVDSRREEN